MSTFLYPSWSQIAHIYSTGTAIPWHRPRTPAAFVICQANQAGGRCVTGGIIIALAGLLILLEGKIQQKPAAFVQWYTIRKGKR